MNRDFGLMLIGAVYALALTAIISGLNMLWPLSAWGQIAFGAMLGVFAIVITAKVAPNR